MFGRGDLMLGRPNWLPRAFVIVRTRSEWEEPVQSPSDSDELLDAHSGRVTALETRDLALRHASLPRKLILALAGAHPGLPEVATDLDELTRRLNLAPAAIRVAMTIRRAELKVICAARRTELV